MKMMFSQEVESSWVIENGRRARVAFIDERRWLSPGKAIRIEEDGMDKNSRLYIGQVTTAEAGRFKMI
jgi:hypothetical protein